MPYTLRGKISQAHPYQLDKTLTVPGAGAEAESTGKAIEEAKNTSEDHIANKENPHNVTKAQVGLGNVDNTADTEKPVSVLQAEAIADAKKAGTDAQIAAENAQETANNALTAVGEALTESKSHAETVAGTALTDSKTYTDGKHLTFEATLTTEWTGKITEVEKTDEESGEVWKTEQVTAPYSQVVTLEGVLETDHPHVMPVYSEELETALLEKEAWAMVSKAETADGSITFTCFEEKPATAISLQIEVNR